MRVTQVSTSAVTGGAARAAARLHRALLNQGADSQMLTLDMPSGEPASFAPKRHTRIRHLLNVGLNHYISRLQLTPNTALHDPGFFGTNIGDDLETMGSERVNLHWVGASFLSVAEIGRISAQYPTVWTLHDEWSFAGAEHLFAPNIRIADGYFRSNRPSDQRGLDVNRIVWQRKNRLWNNPATLVAPSQWMANLVRCSRLLRDWPVEVIPNALDTLAYRPLSPKEARARLGLPGDEPLVLFGAGNGIEDFHKGFDLFEQAMRLVNSDRRKVRVLVLGRITRPWEKSLIAPYISVGHVDSDEKIMLYMNAADCVVVPSRRENFPQMATEAHACGTPVVAFHVGGLPEIVVHGETGYLADNFEPRSLARGILEILDRQEAGSPFSTLARRRAEELWSAPVIAGKYVALYEKIGH